MAKTKILIVQNAPTIKQKENNLKLVETMLEPHQGEKFDLVILPELFAVGWHPDSFVENAELITNSPTLDLLKSIATRFNSYVIGGSFVLKEENGTLRNACPILNRNGKLIDYYSKI